MPDLTQLSAWQKLQSHFAEVQTLHMNDLFKQEKKREALFQWQAEDILVDASHNLWNRTTLDLLIQLLESTDIEQQKKRLFTKTLGLYPSLRDPEYIENAAYFNDLKRLTEQVQAKKYQTIIHIGMGGSHLGMDMAIEALRPFHYQSTQFMFIDNIDGVQFEKIFQTVDIQRTLFIVASKTMNTPEIQHITEILLRYLPSSIFTAQMILITAYPERVTLPIPYDSILMIPEAVSGRFSVWSGMGLSLAVAIGMDAFLAFLQGAAAMDEHFFNAPFSENMPVILGLLGIWYTCFFQAQQQIIIPYELSLKLLPAYLQQLHMESCGKLATTNGLNVDYATSCSVWGALGLPGQHAFYQWLHQGSHLAPVDFILSLNPQIASELSQSCHDILLANCLAQSKILAFGQQDAAHPQEFLPGNRPHNLVILEKLTPRSLGALLALYEHKVFVQSVIWNINAFDQWGVEHGKKMGTRKLFSVKDLREAQPDQTFDFSKLSELLKC